MPIRTSFVALVTSLFVLLVPQTLQSQVYPSRDREGSRAG